MRARVRRLVTHYPADPAASYTQALHLPGLTEETAT